ncbi:MAG: bifunctional DNA-formamidopyrimidine glycosylase/DNA-(apurinic or apyrimidinic site) lyase [Rhizobiales bacterium]|nr:bifunctional DNA-formamidopyrimidine glycosylase/DNA-(apurinic or apyrimidinic site) lyase [Hyphomicrobiales bacterium]
MPELPEVETVRRGLQPVLEDAGIMHVELRRADLRFPFQPDFAARLRGQRIVGLGRRAKFLMADLASGDVLMMHLGMSGSFRIGAVPVGAFHHPCNVERVNDHVVLGLDDGKIITYNDPRRFGFMKVVARTALDDEPLLKGLGPEPLGNAFDAATLAKACAGKTTSLKAALLDQHVVAGLGNIYAAEALHRARLSPKRVASTLAGSSGRPTGRARRLVAAVRDVLTEAIAVGGATLRNCRHPDGRLGYFQRSFEVYNHEGRPCTTPGCNGVVHRFVQNGRATFRCPKCQK